MACGTLGGLLVGILGVLLPPTMFWGEFEINTIADNNRPLPHIWPKGGVIGGLEPFYDGDYPWWLCLVLSLVKMIAISVSVLAGARPACSAMDDCNCMCVPATQSHETHGDP